MRSERKGSLDTVFIMETNSTLLFEMLYKDGPSEIGRDNARCLARDNM